jgi:hypothetical protein
MDDEDAAKDVSLCPNCGARLRGQFCHQCGQNQKGFDRFFLSLVSEAFEDLISHDSRAIRTLFALLLRPGFLTLEYFKGRRAHYVQPLRLYFITSLVCFFAISLQNTLSPNLIIFDGAKDELVVGQNSDKPKHGAMPDSISEAEEQSDSAAQNQTDEPSAETIDFAKEFKFDPQSEANDTGNDEGLKLEGLDFDFLTEEQNQSLATFYRAQLEKAKKLATEDPAELVEIALDSAPILVFCLLPIFALLLKLIYFKTGRYYTEHLVFAVHIHCFLYTINLIDLTGFLIGGAVAEAVDTIISFWIVIYLFLGLRNTYGQGWIKTAFKFLILTMSYTTAFVFAVVFAALVNVTIL